MLGVSGGDSYSVGFVPMFDFLLQIMRALSSALVLAVYIGLYKLLGVCW